MKAKARANYTVGGTSARGRRAFADECAKSKCINNLADASSFTVAPLPAAATADIILLC